MRPEQIQASHTLAITDLAVVSEAMLRLCWNKVEPPKRSEGGCLLRTDHMLGGDEKSAFFKQFNHIIEELAEERALNGGRV